VGRRAPGGSAIVGVRGSAILLTCLGVALPLGVAAASSLGKPSFGGPLNQRTGKGPWWVAIGDLNGDGKLDLASANSDRTVSVLLNTGSARFRRVDYPIASETQPVFGREVAIGDLNGDGKPDLATSNFSPATVSVLLNNGDGSFKPQLEYATGLIPVSVAIGDLNGDAAADLAVANRDGNTISVLLGNGDGSFRPRLTYRTGLGTSGVAIGDLNDDGKPDVVTANRRDGTMSVLLNRGDASFQPRVDRRTRSVNVGPESVAIADLNGDRALDVATANWGTNSVSVFLNVGDGSFLSRRDFLTGAFPESIAAGDLNGDGKPDLATANDEDKTVSVLANRGGGRFLLPVNYRIGQVPWGVAIGDLNGDRKPDLATADPFANTVSVLTNATGRCAVPNVERRPLPSAKRAIAQANCRVGKIRRAHSKVVNRGRVISEQPKAGVVLPKGAKVNLVVSRGRRS
jgi:hypothetical protein